jgi:photosystem II stability/assembly factor-like uncharacterized protein
VFWTGTDTRTIAWGVRPNLAQDAQPTTGKIFYLLTDAGRCALGAWRGPIGRQRWTIRTWADATSDCTTDTLREPLRRASAATERRRGVSYELEAAMRIGVRTCSALASVLVLAGCGHAATHPGTRTSDASRHVTPAQTSTVPSSSATPARREPESVVTVWPVDGNVVWASTAVDASGGTEHVVLTRDAGTRWSDVTPAGLTNQTGARRITSLFVLGADHAWLTVGGIANRAPQTLLSTADGGRHWSELSRTPRPNCALDFVSPDRGWCVLDRATMGQDAIELFGTGDGGQTWQRINRRDSPPVGCDKNVGFTNDTLGRAVTACAAGTPPIYRTRDGGARWTKTAVQPPAGMLDSGAEFSGIPVVAGTRAAVAFDLGQPRQTLIYRSTDTGDSWQPVRPPGPTSRWNVDIRTPDSWILIHANKLLSTDDGGRTWSHTTMNRRLAPIAVSYYDYAPAVYFPTRTIGWVHVFATPQLWRTTTAGRTWVRITIPGT